MNKNLIKIIGTASAILGLGATLLTEWVADKKMEERIDEKIEEAFAERCNDEDEES